MRSPTQGAVLRTALPAAGVRTLRTALPAAGVRTLRTALLAARVRTLLAAGAHDALFSIEDDIKPASLLMWGKIFNKIGDMANHAERTGNRLRLFFAQ